MSRSLVALGHMAEFARRDARWVGVGAALTFASALGQTFFVALFSEELRAAYGLSQAGFGAAYALATLAAAAALVPLGRIADAPAAGRAAVLVMTGLGASALLMGAAPTLGAEVLDGPAGWALLVACLFGLRLFGQGLCVHLALTLMAKWYRANRGRALAVAGLGLPLAEAVLPGAAVALGAAVGWQGVWLTAGVLVLAGALPLLARLLATPRRPAPTSGGDGAEVGDDWGLTRGEVLRRPALHGLALGTLAFAFCYTGVFFAQTEIAAQKGWGEGVFAAAFPAWAAAGVGFGLVGGWLVDRWGALALIRVAFLPAALGLVLLAALDMPAAAPAALALGGVTVGLGGPATGAVWAELCGPRHLGRIRAVVSAAAVLATALAPVLMGLMIDRGVPIDAQLAGLAAGLVVAQALLAVLSRRLHPLMPTSGGATSATS